MVLIENGYTRKCKDSLGGLNKIYLFNFVNYSRSQITHKDGFLITFPNTTIYGYEFISNPVFDNRQNENEGGVFYDETLSFQLSKIEDNHEISKFLAQDLRAIVKDRNGKYRILGLFNGLECESINADIGSAKNSFNGYTISLKGQEEINALYIEDLETIGFTVHGETFYRLTQSGDFRVLQNNDNRILQNG